VRGLGGVIPGERLDGALAALAALLGQEPQVAVARGLELRRRGRREASGPARAVDGPPDDPHAASDRTSRQQAAQAHSSMACRGHGAQARRPGRRSPRGTHLAVRHGGSCSWRKEKGPRAARGGALAPWAAEALFLPGLGSRVGVCPRPAWGPRGAHRHAELLYIRPKRPSCERTLPPACQSKPLQSSGHLRLARPDYPSLRLCSASLQNTVPTGTGSLLVRLSLEVLTATERSGARLSPCRS
jgi:hypothetical protein